MHSELTPGVDVPIHLYTLSNNLDPNWDQLYAFQPDVLAYWERLIDKYNLRSEFLFNTEYVGSRWDVTRQVHIVTVRNNATGSLADIETEVLISATGPLAKRKVPNFPGRDSFKGPWFHNLDWDRNVELASKRIAVVGNGSSGVQIVVGSILVLAHPSPASPSSPGPLSPTTSAPEATLSRSVRVIQSSANLQCSETTPRGKGLPLRGSPGTSVSTASGSSSNTTARGRSRAS